MSNAFDKASLVMLPHAYEEGKVYSLKPTDRSGDFTFSRGTDTATRVNASGNIEKETENLLLQSNQFDTTWGKFGTPTLTSGQSGYDGTNDAWLFQNNGSDYIRQDASYGVSTFSIYAKANTGDFILLFADGVGGRYFNLNSGTLGTEVLTGLIESKIESVGNGWYRCIVVMPTFSRIRMYASLTQGDTSSVANIYIQDAQLNQGLVAYPYLETTTAPVYGGLTDDMPRLDYSGGATCPSLLLEPSRTNLITNSEYFGSTDWARTGVTLTPNATISPSGLLDATLATNNVTNQKHLVPVVSITDNTDYSYSVFIKQGNNNNYKIIIFNSTYSENIKAEFLFDSPQSLVITDGVTGGSYLDSDVKDFGNGWYRLELSFTSFDTSLNIRNYIGVSNGTDNATMYYYGFQLEQGSYPTSYIPTYGSSQTRAADLATDSNVIDADNDFTFYFESTLMAEYFTDKYFNSTIFGYLSGYNIGGSNLRLRFSGTNYVFTAPEGVFKYLIRKDSTNMKIYLNGTLERTITTLPTGTGDLEIQRGQVHKTLYFPEALSDSECIALTTV